ncbi:MAG: sulfite exporter TauE/SafE family protein [Acidobacteria bacterium]|nr:sulfite exporter TauE/SafE family protein [Acidobacteriota bacterium]
MHIEWIWVVAVASLLLAGLMKGVSGMGLPLVATPVLALLYDLPTAIAITVPPTVLSDLPILYAFRSEWRQARRLLPLMVPAMIGIVFGTRILVVLDQDKLKGVLGGLVLLFVAVSYFRLIPHLSDRLAARVGPVVGLAAGVLQGAAGQSGPLVSIFLYQLSLPRNAFLFLINAFFLLADSTQLISLASHGLYTPERLLQAAVAACVAMPTLALSLHFHQRISEQLFRKIVLLVLALTGSVLLMRSLAATM